MKIVDESELQELPRQVIALVRDGVYALYEVRATEAQYLLATSNAKEFYFLSGTGGVVKGPAGVSTVADADIVDAVTFSGEPNPEFGAGVQRVNVARV